jgi:hypothetical protein
LNSSTGASRPRLPVSSGEGVCVLRFDSVAR